MVFLFLFHVDRCLRGETRAPSHPGSQSCMFHTVTEMISRPVHLNVLRHHRTQTHTHTYRHTSSSLNTQQPVVIVDLDIHNRLSAHASHRQPTCRCAVNQLILGSVLNCVFHLLSIVSRQSPAMPSPRGFNMPPMAHHLEAARAWCQRPVRTDCVRPSVRWQLS